MDSERNYTEPVADNMQVEMSPIAIAEQSGPIDEIEMQLLDDPTYSNDNEMAGLETATTSTTVPATPLSPSLYASSSSTPFPFPFTSRRTSMRRTRVEEDHDDERDRRHPSQRVSSPSHPSNSTGIGLPSPSSQPAPIQQPEISSPRPSVPTSVNTRPFRFFQHMIPPNLANLNFGPSPPSQSVNSSAQDVAAAAPAPIPAPAAVTTAPGSVSTSTPSNGSNSGAGAAPRRTPGSGLRSQYLGGFTFILNTNSGTTPTPGTPSVPFPPFFAHTDDAAAVAPPTEGAAPALAPRGGEEAQPVVGNDPELLRAQATSQSQTDGSSPPQPPLPPGGPGGGGQSSLADILTRIGLLAAMSVQNSGLFERDVDDPERAKKLVEGLEDVPIGLVRRLERVGEIGGGEEVGGVGVGGLGDGGCAICWERLLVEAEEVKEEKSEEGETNLAAMDAAQTQPAEYSSSPSTTSEKESEKQFQRIVTLPCAHVFHASCLVPWFSKPKQTTCPICRFNIDPENLTYTSRAQRRAQAQEVGGEASRETGVGGGESEGQAPPGLGDLFGFDIPVVVGAPPFALRPGAYNAAHPGMPAPVGTTAESQPAAHNGPPTTDNANGNAGDNADGVGNGTNPNGNTNTNGDRAFHDILAVGFDVYVGHGPLSSLLRGPGGIRVPMSGASSAPSSDDAANNTGTDGTAGATTANTNVPNSSGGGAFVTNANPQAGAPEAAAGGNEGGRTRGTTGTTFAIPVPMPQGLGRMFGDVISRIFGGSGSPASGSMPGTNTTGTTDAPTGRNVGGRESVAQPQGPVVFGPERPPAPLPTSAPSGLGTPPFMLPFGMRGAGANGTTAQQRQGGQPGQTGHGQTLGGQGAPQMTFENFPLFDIIGGLLAPPPATPAADQGQGQTRADVPPFQPQDTAQQLGGGGGGGPFSWTFGPGSPPPRPSEIPRQQQQERKKWTPPAAPGPTLRQRVEKKEQEAGLRCCDVSCGVGPSDEDPWVDAGEEALRQLCIRPSTPHKTAVDVSTADSGVDLDRAVEEPAAEKGLVCSHTFHSSCLVSSERVSLALRNTEVAFVGSEGKEVEVTCPVCRGVGRVSREEWDAGVLALA